jgi:radical SAM enzyme (TIGR01210 family)
MVLMISDFRECPLACWGGKERFEGRILECLTIIFKTSGCCWNQCLMCSYRHERYSRELSQGSYEKNLLSQLAWILEHHKPDDYQMVKIFTSGSFFDPREIPPGVRMRVASAFCGKIVIAETRPEFVHEESVVPFLAEIDNGTWKTPLFCAIGLETSDDGIREKCIRKGFCFSDFCDAAGRARKSGAGVKAYLLFKPLFLTEKEAIDDMKTSIPAAARYADLISLNPCTVQNRTDLEWYWKRGAYRPPYLWSVLEILRDSPVHLTCDPVGGGRQRGAHNCRTCDDGILKGIRDYSLTADRDLIASLLETECTCKNEWQSVLELEKPFCMPFTG